MNISEPKQVRPACFIESLIFSGGQEIALRPDDIILIVGSNNSGKSKSIEEIQHCLSAPNEPELGSYLQNHLVIKGLGLVTTADSIVLQSYLNSAAELHQNQFRIDNIHIHTTHVRQFGNPMLGATSQLFTTGVGAQNRLGIVATANGAGVDTPKSQPQHFLFDDEELMARMSALFKAAFGSELFFDYRATPSIPIHVGIAPRVEEGEDRVSDTYVQKVRKHPRLDAQGDGMKSFAGILFQTVIFPRDITFIDEPEAFLHPPQMRRLGKTLAEESKGQLFIATHSTDILRGFLESSSNRVRVIRIQRNGPTNHAKELAPEQVRDLWAHPQIKYSNALDSIFHEQALICEDDSDCRLYSAVAEHLEKSDSSCRWKDTHYVPTGGKAAIPRVSAALKSLGVPVKIVFDIDLLSDQIDLKRAYESVDGSWQDISKDWGILDSNVRKGVPTKSPQTIRTELIELLQSDTGELPKSKIRDLLKQDKPWAIIKKSGKASIPNGDASAAFERLNTALKASGIFLVEVGEAEGFCREVGNHGPEFVSTLLETKDLASLALEGLRTFVRETLQS